MSRIWNEELSAAAVRMLSIDPGDMDTPMHALAVPDADRTTLKQPATAAGELADVIAAELPARSALTRGTSPAETAEATCR